MSNEVVLYTDHPRMFRNNPVRYIIMSALAPLGFGALVLIVWWWRCIGTTLTVTNKRTSLRKGVLSRHLNEVQHANVRNVILKQSFFQRIFNMGSIGISSSGQSGVEIYITGIKDPLAVKRLIDSKGEGEMIHSGQGLDLTAIIVFVVTAAVAAGVWWALIARFVDLMVASYKGL